MKIVAVVPAYNESQTIGEVVRVLRSVSDLAEVIVIDDGSEDATAERARQAGARVISQANGGKGVAMRVGVEATDAEIIFFADGDLMGFRPNHVQSLLDPVVSGKAVMTVGLRDRGRVLTWLLPHMAPVLGGERAIKREIFMALAGSATHDFGIETVMNAYCKDHDLPVQYIPQRGLTQVIKERKYGFFKGFWARLKMVGQILRAESQTGRSKEE